MIRAVIFDLGNTLIKQQIDSDHRLDEMQLHLLPYAKDTLRKLHRKYRIGILTNTSQSNASDVAKALARLGVHQYIDTIVTSVDVGHEKPHREMFRTVLQNLRVAPEQCIMVGNDFEHDIRPAISMGIRTAYLRRARVHSHSADISLTSLARLVSQISQLEGANR